MKRLVLLNMLVFGILAGSMAQSNYGSDLADPVRVGSIIANVGVGAGENYRGDSYQTAFGTKAALEFGLWHGGPGTITLGPEIGGSFSRGGSAYNNYTAQTFVVAARSAWHYGWGVRGLDTYGGLSAGLGFHHYGYTNYGDHNFNETVPLLGAFLGASYFVNPRFGFNSEFGYDITNFQLGIIFKFQ